VEWYVSRGGRRAGPYSEEQIRHFARIGSLQATDLVWRTGQRAWEAAVSIEGLLTPPRVPQSATPRQEPPPMPPTATAFPKAAAAPKPGRNEPMLRPGPPEAAAAGTKDAPVESEEDKTEATARAPTLRGIAMSANTAAIVLTILSVFGQLVALTGHDQRNWGSIFGAALFAVPYVLARVALKPGAERQAVRSARIANYIALAVGTVTVVAVVVSYSPGSKGTDFSIIFPGVVLLLLFAPIALNVAALYPYREGLGRSRSAAAAIKGEAASRARTPAHRRGPSSASPSNYFVRHWRGELSLPKSYWLNALLLNGLFSSLIYAGLAAVEGSAAPLRTTAWAALGCILASLSAWLWGTVGAWRSASNAREHGENTGWAAVAKVALSIGMLATAATLFTNSAPQALEYLQLAVGHDPVGDFKLTVSADGRTLIYEGMIPSGAADRIATFLEATPAAKTLALQSGGGRIIEAKRIGELVKKRHLDTYVEGECTSACGLIFLAGEDRAATPQAKFGFHRASFPGWTPEQREAGTREFFNEYRNSDISPTFLSRLEHLKGDELWYPTREELVEANVVTRISLGGEAAIPGIFLDSVAEYRLLLRSNSLWVKLEKQSPGTIDRASAAAYAVRTRHGTQSDIQTALRAAAFEAEALALRNAPGDVLDRYVDVMVDEVEAARSVGLEACAALFDGRLNVESALPAAIVKKEMTLVIEALDRPYDSLAVGLAPRDGEAQMEDLMRRLPRALLVQSQDPNRKQSPQYKCDLLDATWHMVQRQSPERRIATIRAMLQK
jgi:uncharacterized protein DUF4339